ncbi:MULTISPECIES: hypothetical protein [unclassified Chryseobacterium]|uniref:hypothetical protein n=1 Tax=unclassified Chryseobacterium TaxID=2593645 RepID=UPI001621CA12|nr:hypothetical protein [Chryseobacterium sp. G0240]
MSEDIELQVQWKGDTGELEFKTGINTGSTTISTEYLFKGKDLVKTINGKATPYNP